MVERRFTPDDWPPPPPEETFVDLLRRRAEESADRIIYHFLDVEFFSGGEPDASLTYGQLDRWSRAVAVSLSEQCRPGDRALLLFAPGLEFMPAFFGCLYAGVIPVPAYPPVRGLQSDPLAALRGIASDCRPAAILTGGAHHPSIRRLCEADADLGNAFWLVTDEVDVGRANDWSRGNITPQTSALLQYTSGTTSAPRGVLVCHQNLMANQYTLQLAVNHMTHLRPGCGVCWLPQYHDMGLLGNTMQSVFVDGPCHFMSPLQFLRNPVNWLEAISRTKAYSSAGPNFAYELCVRKVTAGQKAGLNLSSWEIAAISAEPVAPETIRRFSESFAVCGFDADAFFPTYGLAEATLLVSAGDYFKPPVVRTFVPRDDRMRPVETDDERTAGGCDLDTPAPQRELVGCGRAWPGHDIAIVDPETQQQCTAGQVGEVWFRGPSVAKGYWKRPDETADVFHAHIKDTGQGPFLRTGDLGFLHQGELFVTGRIKDLIIIHGRNHHPADIERTIAGIHPAFRPASTAAIGVLEDGEERLVVLQEIDRQTRRIDAAELTAAIREQIARQHQLHLHKVVLLRNGALPKTTSGKIRRLACRALYEQQRLAEWQPSRA